MRALASSTKRGELCKLVVLGSPLHLYGIEQSPLILILLVVVTSSKISLHFGTHSNAAEKWAKTSKQFLCHWLLLFRITMR